ncbi:MAG: hypothetical protein NC225_08905 [Clostridium sp.]|nr:hypothetical protein [Clostridium sp.]MCM1399580.1 hypothetical protein [Clostridium sp.]MCM1460134.1 hypothetical protein [Bacteroides sp.]
MAGVKKAKKPKKAKEPKKAKKYKLTKEQKKLLKDAVKHRKEIEKAVKKYVSVFAVLLCIISSGLDVIINNKKKGQKTNE